MIIQCSNCLQLRVRVRVRVRVLVRGRVGLGLGLGVSLPVHLPTSPLYLQLISCILDIAATFFDPLRELALLVGH